jgi:outer membrane receptor protein involved in Fe transport
MRYFLSFILIIFSELTFSQTGNIEGKLTDMATGKPLSGVSVMIDGLNKGTSSNIDGFFNIKLTPGRYTLKFSLINYRSKEVSEVEVKAGEISHIDISLEVAAKSEVEVIVKASSRKESVAAMINYQRTAPVVAQVVSAEAIRRSPDRNTGEVLKRVPGASIQEGKYLVIRGLADRYNQSMLNGVLLSSTEPDRKTFSFDILPSSMVDNIVINKAFIPELPGEWAGGLIQVNTKDVPVKDFFNVQIGTGFNTQTIGNDFYSYQGGKLDFLGWDDGTRSLPEGIPTKSAFANLSLGDKASWGKQFNNIWTADRVTSGLSNLNQSLQMSGGFSIINNSRSKAAAVLSVFYNRSVRRTEFSNRIIRFQNNIPDVYFDYDNNKYNQEVLAGALGNLTWQIRNNHKISWKNILNINSTNYSTIREGKDFEGRFENAADQIRATELAFKTNTFFNTQLSGEHFLKTSGLRVNWFGSFNILDQYVPDQRRVQYIKEDPRADSSPYVIFIPVANTSQKNGSRYYGFLNDYIYTSGGDVAKSFKMFGKNQTLKAGYFFQVKDRLFDSRAFAIYAPGGGESFKYFSQDKVFASENFSNGSDDKLYFNELAGNSFRYIANSILNAGFLQFDNQFSDQIRIVWGMRVENFDQVVGSMKKSDPRHVYSEVRDYLPAFNLTYKLDSKTSVRAAGSQTVIRPEFRELSIFQFFDFEVGATVAGNPGLKRTKVSNFDVRFEKYPGAGELFTFGIFYKYFQLPLEIYFNPASGDGSTYNFLNADEANSFGAEFEFRKKLEGSALLKNFTLQGNASYIYNRVKSLDRPMQGQSPYLLNAGIQYDLEKYDLRTTLLFNQIGRRIALVGGSDQPPTWENPRAVLDLQISKRLMDDKAELKLNISDMLNQEAIFYWDVDDNKKYNPSIDAYAIKRKLGANVSISFAYNF